MNGVLKILKADGIRQQIVARCIRCSGYKGRPNDQPPHQEDGKFVQVNGRIVKVNNRSSKHKIRKTLQKIKT